MEEDEAMKAKICSQLDAMAIEAKRLVMTCDSGVERTEKEEQFFSSMQNAFLDFLNLGTRNK
jgi:hypothetical protein